MANSSKLGSSFAVTAYVGDNKTLLAFNFTNPADAQHLAGFTIECKPPGQPSYFLLNELQLQNPAAHARDGTQPARSTVNAPIQKYRWTHVPSTSHQGVISAVGNYIYTVTPRYFDNQSAMLPLSAAQSVSVTVAVGPFKTGSLALGFTRGYMQSEAFAHHFGVNAKLQPPDKDLLYDTTQKAGTNSAGLSFTFVDEYVWMGSTARQRIFALLNAVVNDSSLHLDVFAYDLNEPDILKILLTLGKAGRVRLILDNSQLHIQHQDPKSHKTVTPPEATFADLFDKQAKAGSLVRGSFDRFSHDKIFIVSKAGVATQVLTGSTNFSVTGLYVNANHVLVFDDPNVAAEYAKVFDQTWQILQKNKTPSKAASNAFSGTPLATAAFQYQSPTIPRMQINFSPHTAADTTRILGNIATRIEGEKNAERGNVLFAVMQLTGSETPVYKALNQLFASKNVYSSGISDAPEGTHLYAPGSTQGILVTGKPGQTTLPPPFDQVAIPPGHEIHDKFVVCGLNGNDPVVYCGSSNLATGGEQANGDNLLEIHDSGVAAAFAIEALLLVDHYNFLDRYAKKKSAAPSKKAGAQPPSTSGTEGHLVTQQPQSKQKAAASEGMFLYTDDVWSLAYFNNTDLHFVERELFAHLEG